MLAENMSKEEAEKKIESLTNEAVDRRYGLWDATLKLRGLHMGQDR
jgi:hypothetical protein